MQQISEWNPTKKIFLVCVFLKINVLLQRGKTMTLMMKGSVINKFTAVWCLAKDIIKTMTELSLIQLNAFLISVF